VKVKLTPRAQRRIKLLGKWWRENRPNAPNLFEEELAWAQRELISRPHLASHYETVSDKTFRRLLLPRTEQHVYYVVEEAPGLVIIHTVWGARRGRGPKL
jgi:plasmid stabilization system protein ParE